MDTCFIVCDEHCYLSMYCMYISMYCTIYPVCMYVHVLYYYCTVHYWQYMYSSLGVGCRIVHIHFLQIVMYTIQ